MALDTFVKNIDKHLYEEGANWSGPGGEKTTPVKFFCTEAAKEGIGPDDKTIEKRERHYLRKYKVPEFYEHTDRATKIKEHAYQTWYVEEVFKALKTPVVGPETPTVAKAFTVTATQAIFPIFYDTAIIAGMLAMPLLDRLVSQSVQVNSGTADHVVMNENTWDRATGEIGEWTRFPEMSISATNAPIILKKWGGILKASAEAIRRARLPIFQRGLERIGRQLAIDLTDFALDVLILGDGNTGTALSGAADIQAAASTGNPTYFDLVSTFLLFKIGYEPTDMLATKESWLDLLTMSEFKDPLAGFRFQANGVPPTPLGLDLHRWDSLASSGWATTKILLWQRDIALIQYSEGGITSDSNRIVNGQWEEIATSLYTAFAIADREARKLGSGW
jgi:hypothetical protein